MRALRNFICHKGSETRRFKRGDKIPENWVGQINAQSLVDAPLEHLVDAETGEGPALSRFPEYQDLKTVDEVLGWAGSPDDYDERIERVNFALERELAGRGRKTLVGSLRAFLSSDDEDEG